MLLSVLSWQLENRHFCKVDFHLIISFHFVILNTELFEHEVKNFLAQNAVFTKKKRFEPDFPSSYMFVGIVDEKATVERENILCVLNGRTTSENTVNVSRIILVVNDGEMEKRKDFYNSFQYGRKKRKFL